MRVLLDLLFQHGRIRDQIGEIFAENFMQFARLAVDLLVKFRATVTVSRWVLALPDCSPKVFPSSLVLASLDCSFDIYIT